MLEFIREVALEAGALLMANLGALTDSDIGYKGYIDLVTRIDRESEDLIVRRLRASYPDHGILAEESARRESRSGYTWVIDPLDGTTNYVHSFPLFCVSIALCKEDRPVAGVIHAPYLDEVFTAEAGKGAALNGKELSVSRAASIQEGFFCSGFASMRDREAPDNVKSFVRVLRKAQGLRRGGSAALELAYVGAGRLDGFWEINLSAWDVAAGCLIVQESGGKVTDMRGGDDWMYGRTLIATNGILHDQLLAEVDPDERLTEI